MGIKAAILLPALPQAAVEPIPQHVKDELGRPAKYVVNRTSNADVRQNMLAFAQRELHLRHNVPVCFRAGFQISTGESFDHWRPDASETAALRKRFSDRCMEEDGLRRFLRVYRQFSAALHLKKAGARQTLAECCERCKCRDAGAESLRAISCRCGDFAL